MNEVWKDIEGFEGFYQVSNLGRVRSVDRVVDRNGHLAHIQGKVLSPKVAMPYLGVMLSKNGKAHPARVHRLVAAAFVDNPDNLPCVDHIDGNKTNNNAANLRWCTQKQNMIAASAMGLMRPVPYARRTPEQQERYSNSRKKPVVRSDGKVYRCTSDAAEDLGVTYSAVMHVLRGLTKTCQGYSFSYA